MHKNAFVAGAERQAHFTEWMSIRCLDAIQFDTQEARELVGLAGFITKHT